MGKFWERQGSFIAIGDDGAKVEIYREVHVDDFSGSERIEGATQLRTSDGQHVNRLGAGRYEVLDGIDSLVVTTTDPSAQ